MSLSPYAPVDTAQLVDATPNQAQVLARFLDDPLPALSQALAEWEHADAPLDMAASMAVTMAREWGPIRRKSPTRKGPG